MVAGSLYDSSPIETGAVLRYNGSAIINGRKQNAIRGPHLDTIYELSNIFKFDVEVLQGYPGNKYQPGLLAGEIDLATPWGANLFASYQTFQIGRFGYEMDITLHLVCASPVPQVLYFQGN